MQDEEVINHLAKIPVEQMTEVLRRVFELRVPFPEESSYCKSKFYLGVAYRDDHRENDSDAAKWERWNIQAVAYVNPLKAGDRLGPSLGYCNEGICQTCNIRVRSNVKRGFCPICNGDVRMT